MKPIADILTQIKADAYADLPGILYDAELTDFSVYEIGQSRDESDLAFFVAQDNMNLSASQDSLNLVYQLQLPNVSVLDAAKYTDAVVLWILGNDSTPGYDFQRIGFYGLDSVSIDTWPNVNDSATIIFFDLTLTDIKDGCD